MRVLDAQEKQAQFEKDAAAYQALRPGQQRRAETFARRAFAARQGLVGANTWVMTGVDWLYDKLVAAPVKALRQPVQKGWQGLTKPFRRAAAKKDKAGNPVPKAPPTSRLGKLWQATKDKCAAAGKKTGHFIEYNVALGLYRATEWAFDPRTPSNKPFFGNEKLNKVIGTGLGVCAFVVLSAWVGWLEVMTKVWHAQIAAKALTSTAPWLIRIGRQAVVHPLLTVISGAAQFVVIPSIAAARQALKSTPLTQGISYRYNTHLKAAREAQPKLPSEKRWSPSAYMNKIYGEIVEKSAPEYYKARFREFRAQRHAQGAEKPAMPVQPAPDAPPAALPPAALIAAQSGKAFNDNAPPPAVAPANKEPPPAAKPLKPAA